MDGILNFGGLSRDMIPENPRFSVLPVPYDLTTSYVAGARNGPRAIIEASTHMELYDEELRSEPFKAGVETLPLIEPTALGPEEMVRRVREGVSDILDEGRIPVLLGGEHSITLGAVEALLERYPKLTVLQLDAHGDLRESYQDTPFNHACVARRISELCPVVQVGIRSLSPEEALFLKREGKKRVKTYYAMDVVGTPFHRLDRFAGSVASLLGPDVYITVDLDVFDPSIMPATGTPEPGGLGWYEVLKVLRKAISKRRVRGFDVMELCPMPGNVSPDFLASKLTYKMMAYVNEGLD